jgi:hypothetical protein
MKYILSPNSLTIFAGNRPQTIPTSHPRFPEIVEAVNNNDEAEIVALLKNNAMLDRTTTDTMQRTVDGIKINGELLPPVLSAHVERILDAGLTAESMIAFWNNVKNNNQSIVGGLFDFLAYKALPITEDGCFLAYKGVEANGWSKRGNKSTVVVKGKVDSQGRIYNGVGEEIEVARRSVCDDRDVHCGEGVHVGSLDYAKGWGPKVVVVKVNPKDVVSIPKDCSCQKLRSCGYVVVDEFAQEITTPVRSADGKKDVVNTGAKEMEVIKTRLLAYIIKNDGKRIEVRRLCNIFSPKYVNEAVVLTCLGQLGIKWRYADNGKTKLLSL